MAVLGRHGDHPAPLKFQADVLDKFADLAGPAPQSGRSKDAVAVRWPRYVNLRNESLPSSST
jgi:hypothetical protein